MSTGPLEVRCSPFAVTPPAFSLAQPFFNAHRLHHYMLLLGSQITCGNLHVHVSKSFVDEVHGLKCVGAESNTSPNC